MRTLAFKMKLTAVVLFICVPLLFNVTEARADQAAAELAYRQVFALYHAYLGHSDDEESLFAQCEAALTAIRSLIGSGQFEAAIAEAQPMIDEILAEHPGFTIYITDDGILLLQEPATQALIQGERGYIPFAIFNERSQDLEVSLEVTNSDTLFASPQTIPAHQGLVNSIPDFSFTSAVFPVIDVVCTTAGTQTVPLHVEVFEAGTPIDSLDTSFDIDVSALGSSQNLFSYLPTRQTPEPDFTTSIAMLDIDGNGLLDIYFGNYMHLGADNYPEPAENTVWYNQGSGQFKKQLLDGTGAKGTRDAVAVDLDADGTPDHIIDANMDVRIADGKNVIRSLPDLTPLELNETPHDAVNVIAQDINLNDSDPKPQLLICNIDDRVELYANDPASPTGFSADPIWTSSGPYGHIALGDLNNGGVKDLAVSGGGYVHIYRGYANGSSDIWFDISPAGLLWQIPEKTGTIMQLLFSDLDNDNDEDFIIVASEVYVYLNNNGALVEATDFPLVFKYQMPSCADIGDINDDGINDIVIGFYTSFDPLKRLLGGENRIYLGTTDPSGNFTFNTTPAWVAYYSDKTTDIKLANLTEDNLLDLVVANDGQNYLYFNMGSQAFNPVLPKDPASFYKGNIYSEVNAPSATPVPNYSQPTNVVDTIGVNADIYKASEAAQLQANFEYIGAKVAGFWSGFKSEFEGMVYFNRIDAEITAVVNAGVETLMFFNPGIGEKWAAASDNGKTFDNIDTYAWVEEKFLQRYGPSGLLAQNYGWSDIEVLIGLINEPEQNYEDSYETTVEKQAKLFDVAKNIDPNIIVTTSNHGGMGGALLEFNNVAQAIGLGAYDKFDIFRYQFYLNGGSLRGSMENDENWFSDEFYSPSFPLYEWAIPYITDLLTDPTLPWAGTDYGICMGEGGNKADVFEVYSGPLPQISPLPFISQSQWANEVVGNQLRNIVNFSQATCPNDIFSDTAPAAKLALRTLIETLDGYESLDSEWPEMLNDDKVIVYKFQNTTDNSFTYWVRAFLGYGDEPFTSQTITLELSSPASIHISKTLFDGEVFTGNDVVAVNEDYMDPELYPNPEDRWEYRNNVTHGDQPLVISQNGAELTVVINDYIWCVIQEVPQGSNFAPNIGPIAPPEPIAEGDELTINLTATDPNEDRLTFSYSSEPEIDNAAIISTGLYSADFEWTPGFDQAGTYEVTFTVTDGELTDSSPPITITVDNVNQEPEFGPIQPETQRVFEGEALDFELSAFDRDGDDLYFEVVSAPDGFRMKSTNPTTIAEFYWETNFNLSGEYDAVISVTDRIIAEPITTTVHIEVINVNQDPELHPMGPYTRREGVLLEFTAWAIDPDGDAVTYSSPDLPDGATLDPQSGQFSWTPDYNQGAIPNQEHVVTIIARDDQEPAGQDSETVYIYVEDVNRDPVLDPLPQEPYTINEAGGPLVIDLSASDPDVGDTLTFSYEAPEEMEVIIFEQINNREARFRYFPGYDQSGTYHVRFTVMDQGELRDDQTVTIEVGNVNRLPEFTSIPESFIIAENEILTFTVTASDPDLDHLIFGIDNDPNPPPDGFHLVSQEMLSPGNHTATFGWQPNYNQYQPTPYEIEITVSDPYDTISATIFIRVNNTNRAPQLHALGGPYTVEEMTPIEFTAIATDPDNDPLTFSSPNLPTGATLTEDGDFSWTPGYDQGAPDPGEQHDITIVVRDHPPIGEGEQVEDTMSVFVINLNRAPVLNSLEPSYTVSEGQNLTFTLSGSDPDGDPITYHTNSLPEGATLNENTGVFSWTPSFTQARTYNLSFYAVDVPYGAHSNIVPTQIIVLDVRP